MLLVGDACLEFDLRPAFIFELVFSRDIAVIALGEPA